MARTSLKTFSMVFGARAGARLVTNAWMSVLRSDDSGRLPIRGKTWSLGVRS